MNATLTFHPDPAALAGVEVLAAIGRSSRLLADDVCAVVAGTLPDGLWERMVKSVDPGDEGRATTTWTSARPEKVIAGVLPEACSRHNTPTRAIAIPRLLGSVSRRRPVGLVFALDDAEHAIAVAAAVGRSFPTYTAASRTYAQQVTIVLLGPEGPIRDVARLQAVAEATRIAADLVDRPPNQLTATALVAEAREMAREVGAEILVIEGEALREQGLGGLYAVGAAAECPPALVVLDHAPPDAGSSMAWVGKGVVYDTGGLSLKTKTGMVNMKNDMGGAAAVIGAFKAAVQLDAPVRLTAVLCIAENAVGPRATRPDDILTMFSGRTVEVNNTDAEGRLVLADGMAWVVKHRDPDVLIDLATLTGAQAIATGKRHAAVYCNNEDLERRALRAGRASGDLVHPLPYAPEFFRKEFQSQVADMRNSVKDRSNAQSSCAAEFLAGHVRGYTKPWLHVDLAGPAWSGGRGTGFGVALLLTLAGVGPTL